MNQPALIPDACEPKIYKTAKLSDCGRFRYLLGRSWRSRDKPRDCVNFVMLNPSTADARIDDPTIRRCMGFARSWGCNEFVVTNVYPIRTPSPMDMKAAADRLGPEIPDARGVLANYGFLRDAARDSDLVVCAWGVHAEPKAVALAMEAIEDAGHSPHCLRVTKDGHPCHPLYLPSDLKPIEWSPKS